MVETISASTPASAPKPTALTNRMATITGWKERHTAMTPRIVPLSAAGARLRAAASPSGSESTIPAAVASTAICRLSSMPALMSCSLSGSRLGGNMRPRKRSALPNPVRKRAQVTSSLVAA